jgi:uncharacterized membrane protein
MAASKAQSGGFFAHWRFNLFVLLVLVGAPAGGFALGPARGFIVAFDVAALVFIASAIQLMLGKDSGSIRQQAARVDANRLLLLTVTCVMLGVVMTALVVELGGKKHDGWGPGIAVATLAIAWLFTSFVYALHYAHLYYDAGKDGKDEKGLDFPGQEDPDYWDFLYFSIVLGSTFQVSDVEITRRGVRRIAMIHGLVAFFFNIGVVALTINVVGSAL